MTQPHLPRLERYLNLGSAFLVALMVLGALVGALWCLLLALTWFVGLVTR